MRRLGMLAALAATGLAAACSAPAEPPGPSTPSSPSVGHGSLAYCLGEHGVPAAPGPSSGPPPGIDRATWEAAMSECASLAPGPTG